MCTPRPSPDRSLLTHVTTSSSSSSCTVLASLRISSCARTSPPSVRPSRHPSEIHAQRRRSHEWHAELEAAKQRGERAKVLEKEAVTRRQAEKAAALEKRKKAGSPDGEHHSKPQGRRSAEGVNGDGKSHGRSLSAEMLGGNLGHGGTSRRLSVMKVEDWQRYQQHDTEFGHKPSSLSAGHSGSGGSSSKRDSRATRQEGGVPFPNERKPANSRRKSRDILS